MESVLSVLLFVLYGGLSAQETISLDGEWSFWTPDHPQTTVNIPHTFNVMDGLESYAGKAFYSTLPDIPAKTDGKICGRMRPSMDAYVELDADDVEVNEGLLAFRGEAEICGA